MAEKKTRLPATETEKASTPAGKPERKASEKLDQELEHTFPGSDPPSTTDPSRKVIDDKLRFQAPEVPGVPPEGPPTPPPETPPVELPPQPGPPVEAPPRGPAQTPPTPQAGGRK